MQTGLVKLKERILEAIKTSPLAAQVKDEDVALEQGRDDENEEFLRVTVQIKERKNITDADFESLLEAIESAVSDLDERYPSVRFSDAA